MRIFYPSEFHIIRHSLLLGIRHFGCMPLREQFYFHQLQGVYKYWFLPRTKVITAMWSHCKNDDLSSQHPKQALIIGLRSWNLIQTSNSTCSATSHTWVDLHQTRNGQSMSNRILAATFLYGGQKTRCRQNDFLISVECGSTGNEPDS